MTSGPIAELSEGLDPRYTLIREIGRGSSSAVFLARDVDGGRDVVMKVIQASPSASASERFRRETRRLGQLLHPGLPPLLDAGEASGRRFLVFPFVAGETLRDHLRRVGQLPISEAVSITRQLAVTLAYLHEQGVIHRDLKPENTYLTVDHRALLLDFGLAKLLEPADVAEVSLTADGVSVGTPQYMSPEQIAGDSRIDERTDLYSLGCVLYEMLAGEPPFSAPTRQAVARLHLMREPAPLDPVRPGVPRSLEAIVVRLLAKAPADRFRDANALVAALDAAEREPALSLSGARRWPRRVAWVALALAGIAVAWRIAALVAGGGASTSATRPIGEGPVRVAIVPFDDDTRERSFGWLALGLTRDLADALSAVPTLDIIIPESLVSGAGGFVSADSIARTLRARIVVSGSVDQLGTDVRATIRVRDVAIASSIGTPFRVAGPKDSVDLLRVALVDSVAAMLRVQIGRHFEVVSRRGRGPSTEALASVHRARELWDLANQRLAVGDDAAGDRLLARADSALGVAVRVAGKWEEPAVMRGWLADHRAELAIDGQENQCAVDCRRYAGEARRHAERVLALNPRSPRALTLLAASRLRVWDSHASGRDAIVSLDSAIRDLRAALSVASNDARALLTLSRALRRRGEYPESAEALAQALAADPWLEELRVSYGRQFFAFLREGRVEAASRLCAQGARLLASERTFRECRLSVLGWYGRGASAVDSAWRELGVSETAPTPNAMVETWGYRRAMVAAVLARSGLGDSARSVLDRISSDPRTRHANFDFERAFVLLTLGDTTGSLAALKRFLEHRPQRRGFVREHAWFTPLQGVPAFRALVADQR